MNSPGSPFLYCQLVSSPGFYIRGTLQISYVVFHIYLMMHLMFLHITAYIIILHGFGKSHKRHTMWFLFYKKVLSVTQCNRHGMLYYLMIARLLQRIKHNVVYLGTLLFFCHVSDLLGMLLAIGSISICVQPPYNK